MKVVAFDTSAWRELGLIFHSGIGPLALVKPFHAPAVVPFGVMRTVEAATGLSKVNISKFCTSPLLSKCLRAATSWSASLYSSSFSRRDRQAVDAVTLEGICIVLLIYFALK